MRGVDDAFLRASRRPILCCQSASLLWQ